MAIESSLLDIYQAVSNMLPEPDSKILFAAANYFQFRAGMASNRLIQGGSLMSYLKHVFHFDEISYGHGAIKELAEKARR